MGSGAASTQSPPLRYGRLVLCYILGPVLLFTEHIRFIIQTFLSIMSFSMLDLSGILTLTEDIAAPY